MDKVIESFINQCDEMMIAEEATTPESTICLIGIGAAAATLLGTKIYALHCRLKRKKEETARKIESSKVYDNLYLIDTKKVEGSYKLEKYQITACTSKQETLKYFSYNAPQRMNNDIIEIAKSFYSKICNTAIYLYTLDGKEIGSSKTLKQGESATIKDVESGTYKELCDKHGLKIQPYDDSFASNRDTVYKLAVKELTKLKNIAKIPKFSIGVSVISDHYVADYEDFKYGVYDEIEIANCEFRDDDPPNDPVIQDSWKLYENLLSDLRSKLPKNYTISDDWDKYEGTIYLEYNDGSNKK